MKTPSTFWLSLQQSVNVKSPRQIQTSTKPTISCFGGWGGSTHTATTRLTPFQYWWDQEWKVESERWGRGKKGKKDHKKKDGLHTKCPSDSHDRILFSLVFNYDICRAFWLTHFWIWHQNDRQNSEFEYEYIVRNGLKKVEMIICTTHPFKMSFAVWNDGFCSLQPQRVLWNCCDGSLWGQFRFSFSFSRNILVVPLM